MGALRILDGVLEIVWVRCKIYLEMQMQVMTVCTFVHFSASSMDGLKILGKRVGTWGGNMKGHSVSGCINKVRYIFYNLTSLT